MGKRSRARGRAERLEAPTSEYRSETGDVLVLRGALTPKTRQEYAATFTGNVLSQEDAWQRAVEFLFERLAVRWEIAGVPTEGQKALLMRFRVATQDERRFVRDTLREHAAEHFPELQAPGARSSTRPPSPSSWPATASRSNPASRSSCARRRSPRRCCSSSSARSSRATPGPTCGSSCPGRGARSPTTQAIATSTTCRRSRS